MSDSLYTDNILLHSRMPRNYGLMAKFSVEAKEENPLCGDSLVVRIAFDKKSKTIREISFEAEGCVISRAAASLLFEDIKGKTRESIKRISPRAVESLLGISISPGRLKCMLLPLEAIRKAV